ncbi:MAG: hypothetical protein ABJA87_04020 [bacterium]
METTIDILEISSGSDDAVHRFHLDLRLSRTESCVILRGRIDATSVDELTAVLARLDALPRAVVRIDALGVTDIEPIGAQPLLDAARRRRQAGAADLVWDPISEPVSKFVTDHGLFAPERIKNVALDAVGAARQGGSGRG